MRRARGVDGEEGLQWMDTEYVLSYFGKTLNKARRQYNSYFPGAGRRIAGQEESDRKV